MLYHQPAKQALKIDMLKREKELAAEKIKYNIGEAE